MAVVLRRDGGHLVALQADVPDARARHELEDRIEHAEARAQHRHDDDVVGCPPAVGAGRAACRPSPRWLGTSRIASAASSTLIRVAARLKRSGVRALVAQLGERVVHERMIHDVDRHGPTLYNF